MYLDSDLCVRDLKACININIEWQGTESKIQRWAPGFIDLNKNINSCHLELLIQENTMQYQMNILCVLHAEWNMYLCLQALLWIAQGLACVTVCHASMVVSAPTWVTVTTAHVLLASLVSEFSVWFSFCYIWYLSQFFGIFFCPFSSYDLFVGIFRSFVSQRVWACGLLHCTLPIRPNILEEQITSIFTVEE